MTQTLTTEQLRARAKFWREKAVEAKWESVSIAQDMLLNADAFEELAANREAQPVIVVGDDGGDALAYRRLIQSFAPGTKLYTAPPAPAVVKLPTEFYSDEGIVVRLEQVMSALAVVGIQYERKANAKTRCECPASEVPEEMTGGIAMSKHKVKKSNYAQWVKGWNACRAAMLAQPVRGGYKLVPAEPTEDMIAAAMNCDDVSFNADETFCVNFGNIYAAMLAAAPEGGNG